jgi:hypothetical protein
MNYVKRTEILIEEKTKFRDRELYIYPIRFAGEIKEWTNCLLNAIGSDLYWKNYILYFQLTSVNIVHSTRLRWFTHTRYVTSNESNVKLVFSLDKLQTIRLTPLQEYYYVRSFWKWDVLENKRNQIEVSEMNDKYSWWEWFTTWNKSVC